MSTAIENERNELKPCPFCGSEPQMRWWDYLGGKEFAVSCENNECLGASFQDADPEKAIAQWNRREP